MTDEDWTQGAEAALPADGYAGTLAGRVWDHAGGGPTVVAIRESGVYDLSERFATMRHVFETGDPAAELSAVAGRRLGDLDTILHNTPPERRDLTVPRLLSPSTCSPSRRPASPSPCRWWSG